ncbi:MAG TPA: LemA family protein [Actinomycetota bacterium]|jgi:LemA protein|nr:LemA family protein [Actinomycetota bacterium]
MEILWIVLGVAAVIGIGVVVSYNRFVSQKQLINDSWANIDTELRRRYDLIPNLVETVKGYAAHEREVLENVTRARAAAAAATGSPAEQAAAEGPFVAALRQLFAVVENYPQLRANENFLALQTELANTEDRLQTSRRFYNANVRDYNRRVQSFPSNLVANTFHFEEAEFFEIPDGIREAGPPQVNFTQEGPGVSFGAPGAAPTERSTEPEMPEPAAPAPAPAGSTPPPPPPEQPSRS